MRAKTYYVIFSAGYQVSKGKMRKNEEFSEEFSVLGENSSPAPHCFSLLLIAPNRASLLLIAPNRASFVLIAPNWTSYDLIG